MTLAVSLTLGIFSGLPPLREVTSITKEAEAANGVHKAWNWGTKNEFVEYVREHYSSYKPVFSKKNDNNAAAKFGSVNLKEPIKIPGSENETYRYWWFVTLDRYHNAHSHSYGENNRAIAQPSNKVSDNPVWGTTRLVAKPKYDGSGNANKKNGFALDYIDIKGESGKFKIDLGKTINDYGLSMYIIDLKDWMSNKGKYGYQKWANKKENKVNDDKKNIIVTMYLNAVTKTYDGGRNNYHARGLNTKEKWKNATQHMRMASYPEEYDQHYNIPVEFKFQVGIVEKKSHLIIESRAANGSTTYAKNYTNSQFQWAGKVIGNIEGKNKNNNGFYKDVTSIKDEQFKKGSAFSVTKDLINALSQNGQLLLRGVRLERYAVDKTKSEKDTSKQTIITKSYSKGQTSAAKKAGYEYGDVAHVYLTCDADILRALAKNDKKTTKEFSKKNKNLEKGSVDKNTIETKDRKIKVEDEGKFYEISVTKKDKTFSITKKSNDKKTTKEWDAGETLGKTIGKDGGITYQQFITYVSKLNFKIHPYEEYDKSKKKVYEDHLVFIWERTVEPKLSMNTELVSYDSGKSTDSSTDTDSKDTSGKYVGVTSGDHALNVPMSKMLEQYNVASTVKALGDLVPSNNNLTLESFLKGKIKADDKHNKDYYYNRLLYSTGDAVPAILSGIKVNYTDKDGKTQAVVHTAKWETTTTTINGADYPLENISLDEGESEETTYPIWDGRNETIEKLLESSKTLLTNSWMIDADLTKKMKITYVYVTPKTQTTQVNYVDVKSGDKTTTHFLFTDNEKENDEDNEYDKFSTSAKDGLSTALHKVTSMLK